MGKLNLRFPRRGSVIPLHQEPHQVANTAFDIDDVESPAVTSCARSHKQKVSPPQGDGAVLFPSSPKLPPVHNAPILQINEIETRDGSEVDESTCEIVDRSDRINEDIDDRTDSKMRRWHRRPIRDLDASNYNWSSEGLTESSNGLIGLARRNSYCPTGLMPPERQQHFLPERKACSEIRSQPTIVRTSSERRFYVSPVVSSRRCLELIASVLSY